MNILFIGDIVGRPGRQTVKELLPELKKKLSLGRLEQFRPWPSQPRVQIQRVAYLDGTLSFLSNRLQLRSALDQRSESGLEIQTRHRFPFASSLRDFFRRCPLHPGLPSERRRYPPYQRYFAVHLRDF